MEKQDESFSLKAKETLQTIKEYFSMIAGFSTVLMSSFFAFINVFSIIKDKIYLNYWNISTDFISSPKKDFLYQVLLSLVFLVLLLSFGVVVESFFATYYHDGSGLHFYNYANKMISKEIRKAEEKAQNDNGSENTEEEGSVPENDFSSLDTDLQKLHRDSQKIEEQINIRKKKKQWVLFSKLFFAFLIYAFSGFVTYTYFNPRNIYFNIQVSILYSLLSVSCVCLENILFERKNNKLNYEIMFGEKKTDDAVASAEKEVHQTVPVYSLLVYFSKRILAIAFAGLILILGSTPFITLYQTKHNKAYYVLEEDGIQYVYIYNSDNNLIFEEAEINEKELTIRTSQQIIRDSTNLSLQRKTFDKVSKK